MVKAIGYCRVNRSDGNLEYQRQRIESYANEKQLPFEIYQEVKSGIDTDMTCLNQTIESVTDGDFLVVTSYDRLTRDSKQATLIIQTLKEKDIKLIVLDAL